MNKRFIFVQTESVPKFGANSQFLLFLFCQLKTQLVICLSLFRLASLIIGFLCTSKCPIELNAHIIEN